MARYKKIHVAMYADAKYRALSRPQPNGQSLWVYLLTGPHTTAVPGLSSVGEAAMAEALGWNLEGFRHAFAEASTKGMVEADWEARVVWIPNAVRYNPPESINAVKSWGKAWDEIPDCALKVVAFTTLKAFTEGMGLAFGLAFGKACGMPCLIQEQEQEQYSTHQSAGADVSDKGSDPAKQSAAADAGKGKPEKARKPKPVASGGDKPEHAKTREYFRERWKARNGADYAWKHGRDDAHVKWILDQVDRSDAEAKALIDAFLKDEDPWLAERGHELGLLVSRFNRYRAKPPEKPEDNGFVRRALTAEDLDFANAEDADAR